MSNNTSEVAEFYDDYTQRENKIKKNLRHYFIQDQILKNDFKKDANILEVGCSNGALSGLLCSKNTKGHFLGVDISPNSIDIAKNRLKKYPNANFDVSDMSDFSYHVKFDTIVFPDVLEHIPEENHKNVFDNIARVCKDDSKIFINIPSPELNNYLRREEPEQLQIIDQELDLGKLISNIQSIGFVLDSFERHSIFRDEKDYIMMWFRRKKIDDLSKHKNKFLKFFQKQALKIKNL